MFFLQLSFVPTILTKILYFFSLGTSFFVIGRRGLKGINEKLDVVLILIFFIHYLFSCLIFSAFIFDSSWVIKDLLYSLLPLAFYFFVRLSRFAFDSQTILKIILFSILLNDIIALILYFFPSSPITGLFIQENFSDVFISYALSGILGVICLGFINVIGVIICLFSPIKIQKIYLTLIFFLCVFCIFLTGQRTPIGGFTIAAIVYIYKNRIKGFVGVFLLVLVLGIVYNKVNINIGGISVKEAMVERTIGRFRNLKSGDSGRNDQYLVQHEGAFEFLIGSGVGKHSPENPTSIKPLPDAMYYRIYNEMGIVGLSVFLLFFAFNIFRALINKNAFMIALITYVFFANYFNRVLFLAPISVIPYLLIALFNWNGEHRSLTGQKFLVEVKQ